MNNFEDVIRSINHAAFDVYATGSSIAAATLSRAIHTHHSDLASHDKLHESFARERDDLLRTCFDWIEAAAEKDGASFAPTLSGEALACAREIVLITSKFNFISGLKRN